MEPGDIVYAMTPEDDGWMTVKTEYGDEGEIPTSCIHQGYALHNTVDW